MIFDVIIIHRKIRTKRTNHKFFKNFFQLVHELGMYGIVRPGPYTCSECDNGGFPYWLMTVPGLRVRCTNGPYLKEVRDYWSVLLPKIAALQYDKGGPLLCMQIENEYGSYGHDTRYIKILADMAREFGITVPLFTADGILHASSSLIDGVHLALNFGFEAARKFDIGGKLRPDDPPFSGEFWGSWFDHWGDPGHVVRDPEEYASELDDILRLGGSADIYMTCGGTQFGFRGGANQKPGEAYMPDAATYDFDAPISEYGDIMPKYHALKKVIRKYRPQTPEETPENPPKAAYGKIDFTETALLFDNLENLSQAKYSVTPLTFEELGQAFGFVLYRTKVTGPCTETVSVDPVRDRAHVFLNGKLLNIFYRNDKNCTTAKIDFPAGESTLDILVENLGRINFGIDLCRDFKGITGCVRFGQQMRFDFDHYPLPLSDLSGLEYGPLDFQAAQPAFHRGRLLIEGTPRDTFLRFPGVHGCIFVNGFNLGRYWDIGPQQTLYLPGCLLQEGENEFVVFETDKLKFPYINSVDKHDFGKIIRFADMIHTI